MSSMYYDNDGNEYCYQCGDAREKALIASGEKVWAEEVVSPEDEPIHYHEMEPGEEPFYCSECGTRVESN